MSNGAVRHLKGSLVQEVADMGFVFGGHSRSDWSEGEGDNSRGQLQLVITQVWNRLPTSH